MREYAGDIRNFRYNRGRLKKGIGSAMATQHGKLDGQNNVFVQIAGDNNAVNLKGLAHLTLTRYLTRRRIDSDIDILSPYSRSIPLIGREAELADLRAWLTSDKPIAIRVLTGRGGRRHRVS
jgi:hypothetical protein